MYNKLLGTLQERNISRNRLARECNITPSDLYSALKGEKRMFPRWRKSISEYLDVDETILFEENDNE